MAKYVNPNVLNNGLTHITSNANQMVLIPNYADNYSTINSSKLCTITMVPGDFTLRAYQTDEREIEVATKSTTADVGAPSPDLHVALLNSSQSEVLTVANETSNQPISQGNEVVFPAWIIRAKQPV